MGRADSTGSGRRRRTICRDLCAIGLAAVGGLTLAPSPPRRPTTVAATADDAVPFEDERIASESATPIARFQYRPDGDEYVPTCPINVVFPLADNGVGLGDVLAVLDAVGWTRHVEEYARYAWDRTRNEYVHQDATAAETALGLHGRLHARCWSFEGVVSMQAHEDTPARPTHGITTYVGAREAIEGIFHDAEWRVTPSAVDLTNGGPADHDGLASVIQPPGAGNGGSR